MDPISPSIRRHRDFTPPANPRKGPPVSNPRPAAYHTRVSPKSPFQPKWSLLAFLLCLTVFAPPLLALEPDQILLITNKNVPDSQKLANLYASSAECRRITSARSISLTPRRCPLTPTKPA